MRARVVISILALTSTVCLTGCGITFHSPARQHRQESTIPPPPKTVAVYQEPHQGVIDYSAGNEIHDIT